MTAMGVTLPLFTKPVGTDRPAYRAPTRPPPSPGPPRWTSPAPPLVMDPVRHAAHIARCWARVLPGPGEHCWIWTGAISDDGLRNVLPPRDGREQTHKAHRVAVAAALGVALPRPPHGGAWGLRHPRVLARHARPVPRARMAEYAGGEPGPPGGERPRSDTWHIRR